MNQLRPAQCIVLVTAVLSLKLTLWDPEKGTDVGDPQRFS